MCPKCVIEQKCEVYSRIVGYIRPVQQWNADWEQMALGELEEAWNQYKLLNLGCSGDRTENVLWRFENGEIDGLSPKLVILLIGTNNTGHRGDPPDQIAAGIRRIIDILRVRMPGARILLTGILPCGQKPNDPKRVNNEKVNEIIKTFADDQKVFFLDMRNKFVGPDGALCDGYKSDGLHLNPRGYAILAETLTPLVTKLMEARASDQ